MDITICTMTVEGDDGKTYELEFETKPQSADYYLMTSRHVKCSIEDGVVQDVVLLDT